MAKYFSSYEVDNDELLPTAFERIQEVARRSPQQESFVRSLMSFVVIEAEEFRSATQMSREEQSSWEEIGADFSDHDAVAECERRKLKALVSLVRESIRGDAAMATTLGVDRSRVSQRVSEKSLMLFELGGERYFPTWQLEGNKTIVGIKEILAAFAQHAHPLSIDHWIHTTSVDLDISGDPVSPLVWLRSGGSVERVVDLVPAA